MLTQERHQIIVSHLKSRGICSVKELCSVTNSSQATIRRDLYELQQKGKLIRVRGGARSLNEFSSDVEQTIRFNLHVEEKKQIAQAAAMHVRDGDNIFIDAGTTTYEMIQFLRDKKDLTVVTNGIDAAIACIELGIRTKILGGTIKKKTHATIGTQTCQQLMQFNFNASFLGSNGLGSNGCYTTPDCAEADIKKQAVDCSKVTFILMDKSKIGIESFVNFAKVESVTLITDQLTEIDKKKIPKKTNIEEIN